MLTTRKVSLAAISLASAGLVACAPDKASTTPDELKRDLELASATTMSLAAPRVDSALLSAMETAPRGTPAPTTVVRRGAGPRAVQSATPTVQAAPDVDVAAVEESQDVQMESIAPVPEPTPEPVAVAPRPAPVVIPASTGGDYGSGGGIFGGTNTGGSGGGTGVVIRGGGVDGDNCELHRRGRGGIRSSGPVYLPNPSARPSGVYDRVRTQGAVATRPRVGGVASTTLGRPRGR